MPKLTKQGHHVANVKGGPPPARVKLLTPDGIIAPETPHWPIVGLCIVCQEPTGYRWMEIEIAGKSLVHPSRFIACSQLHATRHIEGLETA